MINLTTTILHFLGILATMFLSMWIGFHYYYAYKRKANRLQLNSKSNIVIVGCFDQLGNSIIQAISKKYHSNLYFLEKQEDRYNKIARKISKKSNCQFICCDVVSDSSIKGAINKLKEKVQNIDIFLYNHTQLDLKEVLNHSDQQIRRSLTTSLMAPIKFFRNLHSIMQNGQFCYLTSLLVLFPSTPNLSIYNSNHSSVVTYFGSVRQEMRLKGQKNTVTIACPLWLSNSQKFELKGLYKFAFKFMTKQRIVNAIVQDLIDRVQVIYYPRIIALLLKILAVFPTQSARWFFGLLTPASNRSKEQ